MNSCVLWLYQSIINMNSCVFMVSSNTYIVYIIYLFFIKFLSTNLIDQKAVRTTAIFLKDGVRPRGWIVPPSMSPGQQKKSKVCRY